MVDPKNTAVDFRLNIQMIDNCPAAPNVFDSAFRAVWCRSSRPSVWSKGAIVYELKEGSRIKSVNILICTYLEFPAQEIWPWYKSRFQIEFLYRDAKQHIDLEDTQSRYGKTLEFHFNMLLTAVWVAKAAHHLSIDQSQRG